MFKRFNVLIIGEIFMEYILVIIFGIIIGSFLNVCIFRILNEESISYPPSHCSSCKHKLGILDLVPILSFIFLKGRCRYCHEKISIQYPIIEMLNGFLYFLIFYKYGFTIFTLKYCIFASLLIVIGMIDYKTQYVYTSTTILGLITAVIFIVTQYIVSKQNWTIYILGGIVGFSIIGLIVLITKGMGEGDIEIAAVCGFFLGAKGILLTLFIAIILGGITGIVIIALKLKNIKDRIAFGPFLAIGAIVSVLFGTEIINMYLRLYV